ncbi:MAG: chemotaxis protein CheW [Nannocystaceae bacterium]|nr:chemotaxis protein CheW [Nannocystaceae bacterium]
MSSPSRRRGGRSEGEVEDAAAHLKLAGFRVGRDAYAIDIMRIKEVIDARPHTVRQVPHAPSLVEGVIQLRGVVIPVIDLRRRFGVAIDPELERLNKLIIVSVRGRIVGLRVDRIIGELGVAADSVRPAPSLLRGGEGTPAEFFSGVCRRGDEMVFVVNLDALLDPSIGSSEGRGGGA